MDKYELNKELTAISKLKMPWNPALFPMMNKAVALSKCETDKDVSVMLCNTPGFGGANLDTLVIEPKTYSGTLPTMVLFHGGAFVLKASFAHHNMAKTYAAKLPCRVVYTDYRLAPEFPFPTPAEDCFNTYRWVLKRYGNSDVIIAGDSAGGCLSLSVCLMARDRELRMPKAQMLIYPVTDRRMETESMKTNFDSPVFDARLSKLMWDTYLSNGTEEKIEYASPIEAKSFDKFPPTYIEVGQFDCLRDDGVSLYEKLNASGVPAELYEVKGACHGYETATKSQLLSDCVTRRIDWLKNILDK